MCIEQYKIQQNGTKMNRGENSEIEYEGIQ